MAKLRLALTISGAVALGAYEGGVLAGLLRGVEPLCQGPDPEVRLDAIGGASAGSITGLLAARCLTEGIDPVRVMREAWVEQDSIQKMLLGFQDSPLSSDALRKMAVGLFDASGHPAIGHQDVEVRLALVLAGLRGLEYEIRSLVSTTPVRATSHIDVCQLTVKHGQPVTDFTEGDLPPVDVALASGANALGFPPKVLNRTATEQEYKNRGLLNLPPSAPPLFFWYTDGGTLDNEPLGHTLDLVGELDGADADHEFTRLQVLIHPHPTAAARGDAWADPANPPTWLATLLRAEHLQRTQSLYEDLRRVEKTNSRLVWANRLRDELGAALEKLPAKQRREVATALRNVVTEIDSDRRSFGTHALSASAGSSAAPSEEDGAGLGDLLIDAVSRVAGLMGKQKTAVEVISPLVLDAAEKTPVDELLSGEVMGHFGGFFDERMRAADFDLGYASVLTWLEKGGLTRSGLDAKSNGRALEAAHDAYTPSDGWVEWGKTSVAKVALRHPLAMAGLLAQFARVIGQDALTGRSHQQG